MTETAYEKRHRELMLPTVRIKAPKAFGSGTVIYSRENKSKEYATYLLTNWHVVDSAIEVKEQWSPLLQRNVKRDIKSYVEAHFFEYAYESRAVGATTVEAEVMAYDRDEDLALLRLRSPRAAPAIAEIFPRGKVNELRATMPLYCLGAGMAEPPVITAGFICQFNRDIEGREYWMSTAAAIFGNSGGGVWLGDSHELIGVTARMAVTWYGDAVTHLQYFIPITRVWKFLEDQRFRFIEKPDDYTEQGETEERERMRKEEERHILLEEAKGQTG